MQESNDPIESTIVILDGVCYVCDWIVKFVHPRDPEMQIRFANIQSESAKKLLERYGIDPGEFNSSALIENGKVYFQSTCALRILRYLRFPWPLFYVFILLPKFFRDGAYGIIDRKRYDWFGKMDACPMPTPELRARFLT